MHILSTGIHIGKWCHVLALESFHLFQAVFHPEFRFTFSLPMRLRES